MSSASASFKVVKEKTDLSSRSSIMLMLDYNRPPMAMRAANFLRSALALDRRGNEGAAIPLYRRAIRLGLQGDSLRDALVCLGSSLRSVGEIAAAKRILLKGRRQFPGDPVVILFLSLVEHDAGSPSLAVRQLASLYLGTTTDRGVAKYRSVLRRKFHGLGR